MTGVVSPAIFKKCQDFFRGTWRRWMDFEGIFFIVPAAFHLWKVVIPVQRRFIAVECSKGGELPF